MKVLNSYDKRMDKGGGAANGRLCRLFLYIVMLQNRRKSGKL